MTIIDRPIRFAGTAEEAAANRDSHHWTTFDGEEYRCMWCDAAPWHAAASYPCGTEPPRETVEV